MDSDLAKLCFQLDDACPQYEFFYTGGYYNKAICIYRRGQKDAYKRVATIEYSERDHDYVVTKILLQFSGGTIPA